jgi:hypothetical protein
VCRALLVAIGSHPADRHNLPVVALAGLDRRPVGLVVADHVDDLLDVLGWLDIGCQLIEGGSWPSSR